MNYKMLAVDLDGTLLSEENVVDISVRESLIEISKIGIQLVIATGRMFQSAIKIAESFDWKMPYDDVPLIAYNGALVEMSRRKKELKHHKLTITQVKDLIQRMRYCDVEHYLYMDDELYVDKITKRSESYAEITGVRVTPVGNLYDFVNNDPTMILFMGEEGYLNRLQAELKDEYQGMFHITKSFPTFLEIMHKDVSKANGLRILARELGINSSEIIAIGDNFNDIEMIEYAGLGVAVGNAPAGVREKADYVTLNKNGLGVKEVIDKYILSI